MSAANKSGKWSEANQERQTTGFNSRVRLFARALIHTGALGYHPLVAVRDDTGEIVHCRMRSASSQRGHLRFVAETLARLGRLAS